MIHGNTPLIFFEKKLVIGGNQIIQGLGRKEGKRFETKGETHDNPREIQEAKKTKQKKTDIAVKQELKERGQGSGNLV